MSIFVLKIPLAVFGPIFQSALGEGKTTFDFLHIYIWAFATKRFARSRIFRYGLPQDILSKKRKQGREGRTAPPPCFEGSIIS